MWAGRLSVTYVSSPAIVATSIVAVLQAPDGKDNIFCSSLQCLYISLMSQLWVNMNTLQVQGSLLFLCQLSVAICSQIYTVLYYFKVLLYGHVWKLFFYQLYNYGNFCLTSAFHRIVYHSHIAKICFRTVYVTRGIDVEPRVKRDGQYHQPKGNTNDVMLPLM